MCMCVLECPLARWRRVQALYGVARFASASQITARTAVKSVCSLSERLGRYFKKLDCANRISEILAPLELCLCCWHLSLGAHQAILSAYCCVVHLLLILSRTQPKARKPCARKSVRCTRESFSQAEQFVRAGRLSRRPMCLSAVAFWFCLFLRILHL